MPSGGGRDAPWASGARSDERARHCCPLLDATPILSGAVGNMESANPGEEAIWLMENAWRALLSLRDPDA